MYISFIGSSLAALEAGIIPNTIPTITDVMVAPAKLPTLNTGIKCKKTPLIFALIYPKKIPITPLLL